MNIFENLLIEKVDNFKAAFETISKQVFFDKGGKPRHPGEFGSYRETITQEFLRYIIPKRLEIGKGFLINTSNETSTQCDIVIYDQSNTPLIESGERQRFFPVETVTCVGEVKSTMSKKDFKEALIKLAKIKKMKEQVKNPSIIKRNTVGSFKPSEHSSDQIFTFIVCQKLNFKLDNITDELNEFYFGTEKRDRHNLILSIEDGLLAYVDNHKKTFLYPTINKKALKNRFVQPTTNKYSHFKLFSSYIFMGSSSATILYPEITDYMGTIEGGVNIDESPDLDLREIKHG